MAYVRTVKTGSGARAVQIVHGSRRGARQIEHIGSAHTDEEWESLKSVAAQRMAEGQQTLDLGIGDVAGGGTLPISSSRMAHLWDTLDEVYTELGFADDPVFRDLVLARIIEPTSKLDSIRVLEEIGAQPKSYATINRRLPMYAEQQWRAQLAAACATHAGVGPATLVLYDVTTLYFETDKADGFREPGFSKERRLEPQITVGLLTDPTGFPLMVQAFEGNKAEKATIVPTLQSFMAAHKLTQVTVVADAGMVSAANREAIEQAGLFYILGDTMATIPYQIEQWVKDHPGQQPEHGLTLTQHWPQGNNNRRDYVVYYRFSADRARRSLRGINEQVAKAEKAVAGKIPVKRNRFVRLDKTTKSVNRALETKARTLAGWKPYVTNIEDPTPEFVIGAYHSLWNIEKSFRMSKHDLAARPIYHRKRDSIDAHLAVVMAALAITRVVEARSGWSIKKFVTTTRRYRTITIQAGTQTLTAADPLPPNLNDAITAIRGAH